MTTASPNKPKTHRKTPKLNKIFDIIGIYFEKKYEKHVNRLPIVKFYCKFSKIFIFSGRASIAQLVEQLICNQWVGSSSLSGGTTKSITYKIVDLNARKSWLSGGTLVAQTVVLKNEFIT